MRPALSSARSSGTEANVPRLDFLADFVFRGASNPRAPADGFDAAEVFWAPDDFAAAEVFRGADVLAVGLGRRFFAEGIRDGIGRGSDGEGSKAFAAPRAA